MKTLLLLAATFPLLHAQGLDFTRSHYTKYEFKHTSETYPILLQRTPYSVSPYGTDQYKANLGPWEKFAREGFIFAYQDVRGCWMSEGEFVDMRPHKDVKSGPTDFDESTDTYDTIDWLVKNVPHNNGRVGLWGISYPGFYAAAGMIDAHPALKAVSPQAPIADWFVGDDFHHNGAFWLPHAFNFYASFGRPRPAPIKKRESRIFDHGTPDGYKFFLEMGSLANADARYLKGEVPFWTEVMRHGNYDEFWQARNLRPHLKNIKPAVMTVGGWFDAEDVFGPQAIYRQVEQSSPGIFNILVEGPWSHGGWASPDGESLGSIHFNDKTSQYFRDNIEFPFFNYFLKDKGEMKLPEAYVFETGTNQWRQHDAWPPRGVEARRLYLRAGGKLAFDAAGEASSAYDEYLSDPARPVPFTAQTTIGMVYEYMVEDQRFAARRPDVLVYQTGALAADTRLAGPIGACLYASTTGTDSDWVVKLIDVWPDDATDPQPNPERIRMGGFEQLVRGEPMRGKFRDSFEKPAPMTPNQVTKIEYTMPDINHVFRKGHRIMVQIQSSWFPLMDRNPQKFVDIYTAKEDDFQKATQRVYHSPTHASFVKVNVLP